VRSSIAPDLMSRCAAHCGVWKTVESHARRTSPDPTQTRSPGFMASARRRAAGMPTLPTAVLEVRLGACGSGVPT